MAGRTWLSIGSTIVVEYDDGSIRIRQMTEEELADRRKAELEKELAAKSAAIRRLRRDIHEDSRRFSRVAEPALGYSTPSKKPAR